MQWSQENSSPHSSAFYCLCWGNQPLLAVQTSRGVCFSCCFSTKRTSLCDLLSFWRLCQREGDWWTGTSHFSASDTTSYLQWAATAFHRAAAVAGSSPQCEDCTLLLKHLDFICITIFHTLFSHSLSPHLHGLSIAGGVTVPCAPHGLRAAAELWWSSGLVVTEELGKQCCASLSHPGVPVLVLQGAGRALVVPWAFVGTCHGAELGGVCALPFLRQNKYVSAFWHWFLTKESRNCSWAGFLVPSPTLLQCVLFWNTQFSYKQSTLSTTCFCTFWNGALRQINESKYGSLPVKILQTVSSQGHWLRQHIILFTVETENPFLPIQ